MIPDRAGGPPVADSKALHITQNLTLLLLPGYSLELNQVELLWRQMRDKYPSNQVLKTANQLDSPLRYCQEKLSKIRKRKGINLPLAKTP
jgi:transposase